MNEEVRLSRLRISRRRAMSISGTVGLTGLLAACGGSGPAPSGAPAPPGATAPAGAPAGDEFVALLDQANTCTPSRAGFQGPYWFSVDGIRSDIREDRPGTALTLALRVQDVSRCPAGGSATPIPNAVVEIWHCDAGGVYSGFEAGAPNPAGGGQAETTDDGTYLRGAQVADGRGIVRFTTIYPGWYSGRTPHIHCKVHLDQQTVLTTQLFFDDSLTNRVYTAPPYREHTGRDTTNRTDFIFDETGLLTVQPQGDGYLAVLNLGIDTGG